MADPGDWRKASKLTASERYDNIQRIQAVLEKDKSSSESPAQRAFAVEDEAYRTSKTREEYDAACAKAAKLDTAAAPAQTAEGQADAGSGSDSDSDALNDGIQIGPYKYCTYFASGVTSSVYRARAPAAITSTYSYPLEPARTGAKKRPLVALKVIHPSSPASIFPHNPSLEVRILESLRQSAAGPGGSPDQANNHVVPLLSTFHEPPGPRSEQRLVLVFPFLSISMADILTQAADYATKAAAKGKGEPYLTLPPNWIRYMLRSLFTALEYCHGQGIIHRDVKPGALLLSGSPFPFFTTPATTAADPATVVQVALSDFGTAYHPSLSVTLNSEPADQKCLDVGTSAYRAPECLFGHRGYTSAIDLWAAGCVVAECVSLCWAEPPSGISPPSTPATTTTTTTTAHQHKRQQDSYPGEPQPGLPHQPLFASRPANEDGSQLGLILSWFRTLGSPTREEWPEAETYKTPPFDMYRVFPKRDGGWRDVMPRVVGDDEHGKKSSDDKDSQGGDAWRELVSGLLQWEPARRTTAAEALQHRTLSQ